MANFLTFCRIVIGSVFVVSFLGKIRSVVTFQTTIDNFHLLPKDLTKGVANLFLLGEFAVMVCMVIGGKLLSPGFSLAILLLAIFSIALTMALSRKIQTPCNCFGTSSKAISFYDVVRNAGFIVFAMGGWVTLSISSTIPAQLGLPEAGLVGFVAVAYVVIWTHLPEIVDLFRLT